MASSDQDTAPAEASKETLQTESNVTTTAADTKPDDGNTVIEPVLDGPKPAIVQTDDTKPEPSVGEDENPVYSDDEEFPTFDGGQPRGKINHPVGGGGGGKPPRPPRPVK